MSRVLYFRNQQKARGVALPVLRRLVRTLLQDILRQPEFELGFVLLAAQQMARLNNQFLHHVGSTDVITFDYADPSRPGRLAGEIFVCLDEAVRQARRFRTTWQKELVRYVVHGILHLTGHDDAHPAARRRMKRQEDRLVKRLARELPLKRLAAPA